MLVAVRFTLFAAQMTEVATTGLQQQAPIPFQPKNHHGPVYRRDVLGGIIHDYWRQVA